MESKKKFVKKYEWVGDVSSYKEPEANEHSVKYNEPDREYDSEYRPTKADIETLPDRDWETNFFLLSIILF